MWARSLSYFMMAIIFYFCLSYFGMKRVLEIECQQDFYKFEKQEWAVNVANAIPFITIIVRIIRCEMTPIYIERVSLMYLLKGIIQFVTIVPTPSGSTQCVDRDFIGIILNMDNCADMMFSGHTAMTYIMAPHHIKWLFVLPVAITLVLGEIHYVSDVIVATIVASWISFVIPAPQEPEPKTVEGQTALKFDLSV